MPSGLVITRFPVPDVATATNNFCPVGPPQVTDIQLLSAADVREVQVMPSGLVITRFPVPDWATATNNSCPAGPPQVTDIQSLSAADVRGVHVVPIPEHEAVACAGFAVVKTQLDKSPRTAAPTTRRSAAKFIVHRFPSGGPDSCFA